MILSFQQQIVPEQFVNSCDAATETNERIATHEKNEIEEGIVNMRGFWLGLAVGTITTCILGPWVFSVASKETEPAKGISPETVADYVHSMIEAERTFYTTEVVERMQTRGIVSAVENWVETGDLPLPAQFLLETGRLVAKKPNGIRFRLISNWAINSKNSPATDFERTGLTEILVNPDHPYTAVTNESGTPVFQALYADRAVSQSCVGCHNAHPKSPKKDFKLQDVMGGILLTIPLPQ